MTPLWRRGHLASSNFGRKFAGRINFPPADRRKRLGARSAIWIGVSAVQIDHPQQNERRRSEPSLWADEPADDALSLLENALREDEPARCGGEHNDDVHSLREENARLRGLVIMLSELVLRNVAHPR